MIEQIQNIPAMWTPGPLELILILLALVLLFGKRVPEIARGLGKSLTEFKKGLKETKEDIESSVGLDEAQSEENTQQDSKDTD